MYSWGAGAGGKLGHGDENDVHEPKKIQFFEGMKVVDFACGMDHTLVAVEVEETEEEQIKYHQQDDD